MNDNQAYHEINIIKNVKTGEIIEHDKIKLPTEYTQLYVHARRLLARVTQVVSFQLFLWILEHMDKEGMVHLGKSEKESFIAGLVKMGGHKYSVSQVSKGIKELKDVGFITVEYQPKYFVNITAAWKASTKERINAVKDWVKIAREGTELPGNLEIQQYRKADNDSL